MGETRVQPWMVITGPYVRMWGFSTLLKGTSEGVLAPPPSTKTPPMSFVKLLHFTNWVIFYDYRQLFFNRNTAESSN